MPLSRMFVAFLAAVLSALAQPPVPVPNIAAAHIHLNSADPDVAIQFWNDTIGTSTSNVGSYIGVSTLGVNGGTELRLPESVQ